MWAWITLFVVEVLGAIWIWRFISKNRDVESEKNAQISQLEFVKDSLEKRIVEEELKLSSKQEIIGQMGENIRFLQKQMGEMGQEIVDLSEKLHTTKEEEKKQKGRAQSAHTTKGQILEKWCPFIEHPQIEPHWQPKDWSFLGNPIDYIVWDEKGIVFLDVKAGKSQLTKKQRMIRDLIKEGNVEWREIRLE
jgi:predicted Holliday junction resolvase-like endonuclease